MVQETDLLVVRTSSCHMRGTVAPQGNISQRAPLPPIYIRIYRTVGSPRNRWVAVVNLHEAENSQTHNCLTST